MTKKADVCPVFVVFLFVTVFFQAPGPVFALDPNLSLNQYVLDEWSTASGLPSNVITSIGQTLDGYIWFGTGKGLVRFDGRKFTVFDKKNTPEFYSDTINELCSSKSGDLWIGTNGEGIKRFREGKFITFTRREGLVNDNIVSLYRDKTKKIWISTPSGLITFKDNRFTSHFDEFPFELALTVIEDSTNNLWFGTYYYGLYRLKNGKLQNFTMNSGLASNIIYHLLVDRAGNLLAATNNGVCIYKNGFFSAFGKESGLAERIRTVNFLFEDHHGYLWAACDRGIMRVSIKQLNEYCDGTREGFETTLYTESDGLKTVDIGQLSAQSVIKKVMGNYGLPPKRESQLSIRVISRLTSPLPRLS